MVSGKRAIALRELNRRAGEALCACSLHTQQTPGTQSHGEALTSVTAEVDSLKLIEATGVCRDARSEVGAQHGHPSGLREL